MLKIHSRSDSFRRGGIGFTKDPIEVDPNELTEDQLAAILSEDELVVEDLDGSLIDAPLLVDTLKENEEPRDQTVVHIFEDISFTRSAIAALVEALSLANGSSWDQLTEDQRMEHAIALLKAVAEAGSEKGKQPNVDNVEKILKEAGLEKWNISAAQRDLAWSELKDLVLRK